MGGWDSESCASPDYLQQIPELLTAAQAQAGALGMFVLQTYVADGDGAAMAVLQRAGFVEEARLRGRLSDGEAMRDLLVYTAFVAGAQRQRNPRDDYYGQRTAWQADRIRRRAEA